MLNQLLFYAVLKPISLLPLPVLYGLSDGLALLLHRVVRYRATVVRTNLRNAFPEHSVQELARIERDFYQHYTDLLVESIRLFSAPKHELLQRNILRNPELINQYFHDQRSIIITGGHFNNWETAATILSSQLPHQVVGIYAPLRNEFFNRKVLESRGRFGMQLLSKKCVSEGFAARAAQLTATIFATDQSPTYSKHVYWTEFLHQPTAVLLGAEHYARQYNYPVLFLRIHKVKRGFYEVEGEVICDDSSATAPGEITERHTRLLEQQIQAHPAYWLWSHKRWKRLMREDEVLYGISSTPD